MNIICWVSVNVVPTVHNQSRVLWEYLATAVARMWSLHSVLGDAISDPTAEPCHILHKSTTACLCESVHVSLITSYYISSSHIHHRWSNSSQCVNSCMMPLSSWKDSYNCKLHTWSALHNYLEDCSFHASTGFTLPHATLLMFIASVNTIVNL